MNDHSRRTFLKTAGLAAGGFASQPFTARTSTETAGPASLQMRDSNLRRIISMSDLIYSRPVARSEEGVPVGNGRMGSLVWTTPRQLHFQINRVDVYGNNCQTNSFFQAHDDYCGGCSFLDIEFEGRPFPKSGFIQHLSVYDGALAIEGKGVLIRIVPWMNEDVFAITVDRSKPQREVISAVLRMLRFDTRWFGRETEIFTENHTVRFPHRSQTATSRLIAEQGRIALVQDFHEGSFCSKSAVALTLVEGAGETEIVNQTDVRIMADEMGPVTILVASAASFHPGDDVASAAYRKLDAALAKGVAGIRCESQQWWHDFWSKGVVELHSADGTAGYIQQNYHYFLYLMAATSRGTIPPKFNGMLWNTGGDLRMWGAQHWFTNLSCYYAALPATGRYELMDPAFNMYSGMIEACMKAAAQQWGSKGIYIPETTYFNGLEELPEAIAAEMRELYLLRKPWAQRSQEFMEYSETKHLFSSRWNWIASGYWNNGRYEERERGFGPYGPTSHMFSSTAKIAHLYWLRYEYTLDRDWLRDRAYPMLRGAVEFYRNHPNVTTGADGKYHIHWSNSGEPVFGARDTIEDLSSMRSVTASALRASEIIGVDAEMRPAWREFLEHLAPLPTSDDPAALCPSDYHGPRIYVNALKPAINAHRTPHGWMLDINSLPIWFYDLANVECQDHEAFALAQATFDQLVGGEVRADIDVDILSMIAVAAASSGRADAVRVLIRNQIRQMPNPRSPWYRQGACLANRMSLAEGAQALHSEHLGRAAEALHRALLQSNPPAPGEYPVLHLFPAWPREWDARNTLRARGGFIVTAVMSKGVVEFVEIVSHAGASCRLRNPFPCAVILQRNGVRADLLHGSLLEFKTSAGERIGVQPETQCQCAAIRPQTR